MNKASSAFLATAGVTVGLLGFALPAGASVSSGPNTSGPQQQQQTTVRTPDQGGGTFGSNDNGCKGKDGQDNNSGRDGNSGQDNNSGRDRNSGTWGNRDGKPDPCPTSTETPCPPKPCEVLETKPCKPHRDKYGHLQTYTTAKHIYVCHPKPCPTEAKPCPPKCKKTQPHRHAPCKPHQKPKVG